MIGNGRRTGVAALLFGLLPVALCGCASMSENDVPGYATQANPANEPKILASFDAVTGDPGMSYKDHPDMAMAACSNCGEAGQVLVELE